MKPATRNTRPTNTRANAAPVHLEPKFSRVDENDKLAEQHLQHLYIGSMWKLARDLMTLTVWDNKSNKSVPTVCQFPVLVESYNPNDARFPKGMMAIYTGHVYADELANGIIVRVKRPTFIVANGRFIIKDLKNMEPVE